METKYSLKEFLTKESYIEVDPESNEEIMGVINKIEIPMIQRDYAQGRAKDFKDGQTIINDTGSRFSRSLFKALKANEEMELEFIYGSVETRAIPRSKDVEYIYTPLDGQQRLTTLFLLYWYLGMRELDSTALIDHLQLLSKFTYLTRTSSRIFCENLCNMEKMRNADLGTQAPSKCIENRPWFYKEYKKDPTVKAMLVMLDQIDYLYQTENETGDLYLPRMENLKFYAFPLNKYKLSEDLYIKMNARGKQLTSYENFKADLINWMKSGKNPEVDLFNQEVMYRNRKMKYFMAFAQKLDNEWTDIFWNALKANNTEDTMDGKTVDQLYIRFFFRLLCNFRILKLQASSEYVDEDIAADTLFKYFYDEKGDGGVIQYNNNDFEDNYLPSLSFDIIKGIETFLDGIKGKLDIVNRYFVPSWNRVESNAQEESFFGIKITWQKRIAFLATYNYVNKVGTIEEPSYADWMRVVWNFVVDPTIRNMKDNLGTARFINELSVNCNDIIKFLAENPIGSRLKDQYKEEHLKARLILLDPAWKEALVTAESNSILKGRVLFLLAEDIDTDLNTFIQRYQIANKVIPSKNKKDFLWIRAILAQIDSFDIQQLPLYLEDSNHEYWKTHLSSYLMRPMQSLLSRIQEYIDDNKQKSVEDLRSYLVDICQKYVKKDYLDWIYPLVTWQSPSGQDLLTTYSCNQRLDQKDGKVYLCYKSSLAWESSILLSGYRDEIITALLPKVDNIEWTTKSYLCSIHDRFFRGINVTLTRNIELESIDSIKCSYVCDAEKIIVGIRYAENPMLSFDHNNKIWACSKIYSISNTTDSVAAQKIVNQIEEEVFDIENNNSLLSKAINGEWINDVIEASDDLGSTPRGLSVLFPDGRIISNKWAVTAFIDTLKEVGLDRIPQVGIVHSGFNLVSKNKRPEGNWQHEIDNWFVYTNTSNDVKCDDLRKISDYYGLDLVIEDRVTSPDNN